jgi:hypothetical protein
MTLKHISARIKRLDALAMGFGKETTIIGKGDDLLL